ncbi:hypothetical protein K438DRAFT_320752 [Mycena galopus ATCC 62051]|nr:hypothetical protein K438DRAFT_320752 [Mycena galopus ATCC 62051]
MAPLPYTATVLTLLLTCCGEVVNIRPPGAGSVSGPATQETFHSDLLGDSELLDIVLVASVDGKFHALNRTTGHTLWSMSSFASSSTRVSPPSTVAPLVGTVHIDHDPADKDAPQETYIIEPQSGDIYVMATPSSPLQRFPFSMSELVDMSPFSFSAADDHRVFVGRKTTSSLVVELETGNIRAIAGSACPWDPFRDRMLNLNDDEWELDLDEPDGSKSRSSKPTEVFIDRTDYHITIHTRPSSKHRIPVQNLSFSTYGPNNQDNILQGSYKNTKNDAYIQSLPNGEIISFKARGEGSGPGDHTVLWGYKFTNPIVAIFDVLRSPQNTFVLLQPRPRLSAILSHLTQTTSMDQLPHLNSVYIGLVEETGSLFAMSPDRFPLVVFSGGRTNRVKVIDAGTDEELQELPPDLDAVTAERKRREKAMKERNYGSTDDRCLVSSSLYTDRGCLVGIRPLQGGDGDGPEMRFKRLLDGVPSVPSEHKGPSNGPDDDRCQDRDLLCNDRQCLLCLQRQMGGPGPVLL